VLFYFRSGGSQLQLCTLNEAKVVFGKIDFVGIIINFYKYVIEFEDSYYYRESENVKLIIAGKVRKYYKNHEVGRIYV